MTHTRAPFPESLRLLARAVERGLSDHPELMTLSSYLRGELSAREGADIQEHLGWCRRCTAELEELSDFVADPKLENEPERVDAAWGRLVSKLPELSSGTQGDESSEAATSTPSATRREMVVRRPASRSWKAIPLPAWTGLAAGVVAVALLALWGAGLERQLGEARSPRFVQLEELRPWGGERDAAVESRGPTVVELPSGGSLMVLILHPSSVFPYTVLLIDDEGSVRWEGTDPRRDEWDNFSLGLPADILEPGLYFIETYDEKDQPLDRFAVRIAGRPSAGSP